MFSYIWPIALAVLSNVIYHVCSKSSPSAVNPFATLMVTYTVGAIISTVLYCVTKSGSSFVQELTKMNWAPYMLGVVIVGLELGFLYSYKAGWQVGTASVVQSSFLSVILVFVGFFLFKEALTWNKIVGILICMVGLVFINLK